MGLEGNDRRFCACFVCSTTVTGPEGIDDPLETAGLVPCEWCNDDKTAHNRHNVVIFRRQSLIRLLLSILQVSPSKTLSFGSCNSNLFVTLVVGLPYSFPRCESSPAHRLHPLPCATEPATFWGQQGPEIDIPEVRHFSVVLAVCA